MKLVNSTKTIKFEQLDNLTDPLGINIEELTSETFKETVIQPFLVNINKTYRIQATVTLVKDNLVFSSSVYEFYV